MIIVSTDFVTGKEVQTLGLVKGNTIQARNIGRDITQGLRQIVGGELKAYTEMMTTAREIAIARMIAEAEAMGADAIINLRFATSSIMDGAAEVIAYGTAVKLI